MDDSVTYNTFSSSLDHDELLPANHSVSGSTYLKHNPVISEPGIVSVRIIWPSTFITEILP